MEKGVQICAHLPQAEIFKGTQVSWKVCLRTMGWFSEYGCDAYDNKESKVQLQSTTVWEDAKQP